jgi:hypothetical protein
VASADLAPVPLQTPVAFASVEGFEQIPNETEDAAPTASAVRRIRAGDPPTSAGRWRGRQPRAVVADIRDRLAGKQERGLGLRSSTKYAVRRSPGRLPRAREKRQPANAALQRGKRMTYRLAQSVVVDLPRRRPRACDRQADRCDHQASSAASLGAGRPIRGSRAGAPLEPPLLVVKHAGRRPGRPPARPGETICGSVLSGVLLGGWLAGRGGVCNPAAPSDPGVILRKYLRKS